MHFWGQGQSIKSENIHVQMGISTFKFKKMPYTSLFYRYIHFLYFSIRERLWLVLGVRSFIVRGQLMNFIGIRGPPFSLEWGGHKFPKVPRQYFCDPPIWLSKFYDPPPPGATMLKKYVTPNARSAENMHFGAFSLNKIFIKICSHPIICWFFCDPPISHEKNLWLPSFFMAPYSEENDSPL